MPSWYKHNTMIKWRPSAT